MLKKLILPLALLALCAAPSAGAASTAPAEATLEQALAIFRPDQPRARVAGGTAAEPREATLVLRDLALSLGNLSPSDRRLARRILARPTSPRALLRYVVVARHTCDRHVCFWWPSGGSDAPPLADRDGDEIPNWVEKVQKVFATVWKTEIGRFGYAAPLADLRSGTRDGRLDIYLADVGQLGVYGYCATDDPRRAKPDVRKVSVFCVFDNDFARRQFSTTGHGLPALKATAAHEFFHAIQARYDFREDKFLVEGTATWMEDEVFDGVNHNRRWLVLSPLSPTNSPELGPWLPIDLSVSDLGNPLYQFNYGSWIFFRFLSEYAADRRIVREIWERARSEYSLEAITNAVVARGLDFRKAIAEFGVWNAAPSLHYSEGASYPAAGAAQLALGTPATLDMFHLSNDYLSVPVGGSGAATLTLTFDLPGADEPGLPEASVLVSSASGTQRLEVALDAAGNGTLTVPLAGVTSVILVLTNAGTDTVCWQGGIFACEGASLDDSTAGYVITATTS